MLWAIRSIFIVLCGVIGAHIGKSVYQEPWFYGASIGAAIALALVLLELGFARRFISVISIVMFGVVVGFVVAHFIISALYLIPAVRNLDIEQRYYLEFSLTFLMTFIAVIAIIHTKDDFKFVIPFIELSRERRLGRPAILDTSVIIDGRIVDLCNMRLFDHQLILPRFILNELQSLADSPDKLKRIRGRRGLDLLSGLRKNKAIDLQITDSLLKSTESVDSKLIHLAKALDARIITNDFNLNKVAQVHGVEVININELANTLRPVVLQGEHLTVKLVKVGEEPGQGVGFLEDGTMVVAESCSTRIGQTVELVVTNTLQTVAGRMIFARPFERGG
jgi:uncharacterized protein YacL